MITININKSNEIKYYIANPLHSCGFALVGTGAIIQGFLLKIGVGEDAIAFFVSAMLVIQMLAMILTSGAVENMKNMITVSALISLCHIPLLAVLAFFSFTGAKPSLVFVSVFAAGTVATVFYGIHGVLSYKLPYKIMDIKEYGRILGVSGVFLGLASTVFSFGISLITDMLPKHYFLVMGVFFLAGIVLFVLNFLVASSYKEISEAQHVTEKTEKINIFGYKPFYILLMPNILRGFHTGVWSVVMLIGSKSGIVTGEKGAMLTVLLQLALMIGCFVYAMIAKKAEDGKLIFFSSVAVAVIAPFMLAGGNSTVFFAVYLVVSLFKNFIDYGVPTAVTKIVDYRCIGQYSAWRMVLHTLGTAIGSMAVPYMVDALGAYATLIIAGAMQVISGAVYLWYTNFYMKKVRKEKF